MANIGIIISSIRVNRIGGDVAEFVAGQYDNTHAVNVIDLRNWRLPYVDGGMPSAAKGDYETEGANDWASEIKKQDGFIFVTPEYNASIPAQLKTNIDAIYDEWLEKSAIIVSYSGSKAGGASAAKHLNDILERLKMDVIEPVSLSGWATEHHDEAGYVEQLESAFSELEPHL